MAVLIKQRYYLVAIQAIKTLTRFMSVIQRLELKIEYNPTINPWICQRILRPNDHS